MRSVLLVVKLSEQGGVATVHILLTGHTCLIKAVAGEANNSL